MTKLKLALAGLTLVASGIAALPALAEKVTFKTVTLKSSEEVPPNSSKATGTASVNYDKASKKLSWKIDYKGLTGPATMAHFHGPADPGKNAPVAVQIPVSPSPIQGSATLTDAQEADLLAGKYYINVHTEANKGGEIRGQVVKK